jgi:hypothetical protein
MNFLEIGKTFMNLLRKHFVNFLEIGKTFMNLLRKHSVNFEEHGEDRELSGLYERSRRTW